MGGKNGAFLFFHLHGMIPFWIRAKRYFSRKLLPISLAMLGLDQVRTRIFSLDELVAAYSVWEG